MASKDIGTKMDTVTSISPQDTGGVGATVGAIIDTQGAEGIEMIIHVGAIDTIITPSLDDGDNSALSDAASVGTDFLIGTIAGATFAATDDDSTKKIGYVGKKRYVRLTLTNTGGSANLVSALAVKMPLEQANIS